MTFATWQLTNDFTLNFYIFTFIFYKSKNDSTIVR
jgi:hypothetical protein